MDLSQTLPPRSALYMPASNARAIEKARGLAADMIILDLEDAVPPGMKDEARMAAVEAVAAGFGERLTAIRINAPGTRWHLNDLAVVKQSRCDVVIVPKVEAPDMAQEVADRLGRPIIVMIETPRGVLNAADICAVEGVVGVFVGANDLANELRLPPGSGRAAMSMALQTIVLAARASGVWVFDSVFNDLNNPDGLAAECAEGRMLGFDGKTLIHPNQIAAANAAFSPSPAEIEEAQALVAAASGGAERFRDRMIETMHVEAARRILARVAAD
ncbi:CoA ester lyase [Chakrabartia godavariana]|nr:CoA ester lyase [Chakrabartia godavariana]